MKRLLHGIAAHIDLYIDPQTGITWVENGRTGTGHSAHPNIDESGSVEGMKRQYWGECRTVKSHGFIYNVDKVTYSDILDYLAFAHCKCIGCCGRRESERVEYRRREVALKHAVAACRSGNYSNGDEELNLALEEMRSPTFSVVECYTFPVLSTSHIRRSDADLLEKICEEEREGFMPHVPSIKVYENHQYGWRIHVFYDVEVDEAGLTSIGFSSEFIHLIKLARDGRYSGIWLDSDGDQYGNFPTFDW